MRLLWRIFLIIGVLLLRDSVQDDNNDENGPYEFSFTILGEQHRYEKKDVQGIIQGEFGFITADGVYHVTVYATDENGSFKILSMKNIQTSGVFDPEVQAFRTAQNRTATTHRFGSVSTPKTQSTAQINLSGKVDLRIPSVTPAPLSIASISNSNGFSLSTSSTIRPGCGGCGILPKATTPNPFDRNPSKPVEISTHSGRPLFGTITKGVFVPKKSTSIPFNIFQSKPIDSSTLKNAFFNSFSNDVSTPKQTTENLHVTIPTHRNTISSSLNIKDGSFNDTATKVVEILPRKPKELLFSKGTSFSSFNANDDLTTKSGRNEQVIFTKAPATFDAVTTEHSTSNSFYEPKRNKTTVFVHPHVDSFSFGVFTTKQPSTKPVDITKLNKEYFTEKISIGQFYTEKPASSPFGGISIVSNNIPVTTPLNDETFLSHKPSSIFLDSTSYKPETISSHKEHSVGLFDTPTTEITNLVNLNTLSSKSKEIYRPTAGDLFDRALLTSTSKPIQSTSNTNILSESPSNFERGTNTQPPSYSYSNDAISQTQPTLTRFSVTSKPEHVINNIETVSVSSNTQNLPLKPSEIFSGSLSDKELDSRKQSTFPELFTSTSKPIQSTSNTNIYTESPSNFEKGTNTQPPSYSYSNGEISQAQPNVIPFSVTSKPEPVINNIETVTVSSNTQNLPLKPNEIFSGSLSDKELDSRKQSTFRALFTSTSKPIQSTSNAVIHTVSPSNLERGTSKQYKNDVITPSQPNLNNFSAVTAKSDQVISNVKTVTVSRDTYTLSPKSKEILFGGGLTDKSVLDFESEKQSAFPALFTSTAKPFQSTSNAITDSLSLSNQDKGVNTQSLFSYSNDAISQTQPNLVGFNTVASKPNQVISNIDTVTVSYGTNTLPSKSNGIFKNEVKLEKQSTFPSQFTSTSKLIQSTSNTILYSNQERLSSTQPSVLNQENYTDKKQAYQTFKNDDISVKQPISVNLGSTSEIPNYKTFASIFTSKQTTPVSVSKTSSDSYLSRYTTVNDIISFHQVDSSTSKPDTLSSISVDTGYYTTTNRPIIDSLPKVDTYVKTPIKTDDVTTTKQQRLGVLNTATVEPNSRFTHTHDVFKTQHTTDRPSNTFTPIPNKQLVYTGYSFEPVHNDLLTAEVTTSTSVGNNRLAKFDKVFKDNDIPVNTLNNGNSAPNLQTVGLFDRSGKISTFNIGDFTPTQPTLRYSDRVAIKSDEPLTYTEPDTLPSGGFTTKKPISKPFEIVQPKPIESVTYKNIPPSLFTNFAFTQKQPTPNPFSREPPVSVQNKPSRLNTFDNVVIISKQPTIKPFDLSSQTPIIKLLEKTPQIISTVKNVIVTSKQPTLKPFESSYFKPSSVSSINNNDIFSKKQFTVEPLQKLSLPPVHRTPINSVAITPRVTLEPIKYSSIKLITQPQQTVSPNGIFNGISKSNEPPKNIQVTSAFPSPVPYNPNLVFGAVTPFSTQPTKKEIIPELKNKYISDLKAVNGSIRIPGIDPIPIKDKYPNMKQGLPEGITEKDIVGLLYKFNYTVGFHGHYEKGWKNGTKIGGYFVNGRDGYSRVVKYVADENGYRPSFRLVWLGQDSDDTPKPETEKKFGLKNFEFVWYPVTKS